MDTCNLVYQAINQALASHISGQQIPHTSLEMNANQEDCDSDLETVRDLTIQDQSTITDCDDSVLEAVRKLSIQDQSTITDCDSVLETVRNLSIQDPSTITVNSSDSESQDPTLLGALRDFTAEAATLDDFQVTEVNSSDPEYEDRRSFDMLHDSSRETTALAGDQIAEVNSSDSEHEDSTLLGALRHLFAEAATLDDFQVTEVHDAEFQDPRLFQFISEDSPLQVYDPEFQDPRWFQFIPEDTPSQVPSKDCSRLAEQIEGEPVEKHMWPCVLCAERSPETLFTPCSHSVCCQECAKHAEDLGCCPVCYSTIIMVDRIYYTQATCVVCMDSPPIAVFKPCCHAVCCKDCSITIQFGDVLDKKGICPVCNAYIRDTDLVRLAYS